MSWTEEIILLLATGGPHTKKVSAHPMENSSSTSAPTNGPGSKRVEEAIYSTENVNRNNNSYSHSNSNGNNNRNSSYNSNTNNNNKNNKKCTTKNLTLNNSTSSKRMGEEAFSAKAELQIHHQRPKRNSRMAGKSFTMSRKKLRNLDVNQAFNTSQPRMTKLSAHAKRVQAALKH